MFKKTAEVIHAMRKDSLSTCDSSAAYDSIKIVDSPKIGNRNTEEITAPKKPLSTKTRATIDTKGTNPDELVSYAKTLIGIPYQYGSIDPKVGFDCSGFITYVFNHFGIAVPRSSIDFTNVGQEVPIEKIKPGDLVLFTGTNPAERFVGHMGIIVTNKDSITFIHSSSGKANGVTITPLNKYYMGRYVKTIRVFKANNRG